MRLIELMLVLLLGFASLGSAAQDSAQSLVQSLTSLSELHEQGVITDSEFNAAKRRLLGLPVAESERDSGESAQPSSANTSESQRQFQVSRGDLFSSECMAAFEKDINLVRRRRSTFSSYRGEILPHALQAASQAVDGRPEGAAGAIRDQLIAERNSKLAPLDDERDLLFYENPQCFNF